MLRDKDRMKEKSREGWESRERERRREREREGRRGKQTASKRVRERGRQVFIDVLSPSQL